MRLSLSASASADWASAPRIAVNLRVTFPRFSVCKEAEVVGLKPTSLK